LLIVAHRLGFVMANAGVDQSNIENTDGKERVLLLPLDPDGSAAALKARFDAAFAAEVGVIINDSFGRPWRNGVVGVALGVAGLPSLIDMIGVPDLFGRPMQVTEIAVADEIAAGASLLMGQAAEGWPVVVVRGLTFDAAARPASALVRPRELDMFR
jgi:coenzyme F420-0:L-glutamate ligase / coenzyme F420-1:gamma-L-glutamate ligase